MAAAGPELCSVCEGRHASSACPWRLDAPPAVSRATAAELVAVIGADDATRLAAWLDGEADHFDRTHGIGGHNAAKSQAARILAGRIRDAISAPRVDPAPGDGEE
jgi:hypothetical protein